MNRPTLDSVTVVKPEALRTGNGIALIAPASVADPQRVANAESRLRARGYRTKQYRDLQVQHGYLAGSDRQRAAEFMQAFLDDEIQAVLPVRGGYGTMRMLEYLDFQQLARHPKLLVGFSDITALHLALQMELGWVTFHGPHPADGIGSPDGWSPLSQSSYWRALAEASTGFPAAGRPLVPAGPDQPVFTTVRPGLADGRLVGGNLATVCALLGTPYEIQTDDCILFLEDVGEPPYRIDRFLMQLKLAKKFANLAGILLGQFADCQEKTDNPTLALQSVLNDYLGSLNVPVMSGFPAGHDRDNVTFPMNVRVRLDATNQCVIQLEAATKLPSAPAPMAKSP